MLPSRRHKLPAALKRMRRRILCLHSQGIGKMRSYNNNRLWNRKRKNKTCCRQRREDGEIGVVAGLKRDGSPNPESRQSGEHAGFPAFRPSRRCAGQLLRQFLPPMQRAETLRFLPCRGRGCGQGRGGIERVAEKSEKERGATRPGTRSIRPSTSRPPRSSRRRRARRKQPPPSRRRKRRSRLNSRRRGAAEQRRGLQAHRRQPPRP